MLKARTLRKGTVCLLCLLLLIGLFCPAAAAKEETPVKITLSPLAVQDLEQNFYKEVNITCKPYPDKMGCTLELIDYDFRQWDDIGWAISKDWLKQYRYLFLDFPEQTGSGAEGMYITLALWWIDNPSAGVHHYFSWKPVKEMTGTNMVDLMEVNENYLSGYMGQKLLIALYICVNKDESPDTWGPVEVNEVYLSNVPQAQEGYGEPPAPPRLPDVPVGDMSKTERYDLLAYEDSQYDLGWDLGANGVKVVPTEDHRGFTMERSPDTKEDCTNVAWVVPYEQLEKTPYLAIEFGNEGRNDEGPLIYMFTFFENVVPTIAATYNDFGGDRRAHTFAGLQTFNQKAAIDNCIDEDNPDSKSDLVAIILGIRFLRTDGSTYEPLQVKQAFLFNYNEDAFATQPSENTTDPTADPGTTPTAPTTAPTSATPAESNGFPWIVVGIVAACVVAAAVVVVVVLRLRKK
ncbi:MAG: hypothetical protein IKI50_06350 [Clostridia bacterium]|nr:hypothetical protein [Clostridia bacterium]